LSADTPPPLKILGGHLAAGLVVGFVFGLAYFGLEPLRDFGSQHIRVIAPTARFLAIYLSTGVILGGVLGLGFGAIGALLRRWTTPERYVIFYAVLMAALLTFLLFVRNYSMADISSLPASREAIYILTCFLILFTGGHLLARMLTRRKAFRGFRARGTGYLTAASVLIVVITQAVAFYQERHLPGGRKAGEPGANVVLIVLDALRYDHISASGYYRETSPNMDNLATEGVLFTNARSHGNRTIIAMPALFTSLYPPYHGAIHFKTLMRPLPESRTTLAEILQEAGYTTIGLMTNAVLRDVFGMTQGFDRVDEFRVEQYDLGLFKTLRRLGIIEEPKSAGGLPLADDVTDKALKWLRRVKDRPFFLFVHYMDPHHPYFPPPPYDTMFGDPTRNHESIYRKSSRFLFSETGPKEFSDVDLQKLKDYYDGSIRFTDHEIGRLLGEIRELSETRETLVIITSDHGDEFLEHGSLYHTNLLIEQLIHVPLIMWNPKRLPGGIRIDQLVRHIDVLPTIAEITGTRVPPEAMGRSLMPLMEGRPVDLALTSFSEGDYCTSLNYGNWKLMRVDSTGALHLFDLSEYLEGVESLEENPESELDEDTLRQLKALGYL
jgi:arylsulfatase A-like enzyme